VERVSAVAGEEGPSVLAGQHTGEEFFGRWTPQRYGDWSRALGAVCFSRGH
jgi:hypothetical protein